MPKGFLPHNGLRVFAFGGRDYPDREFVFRSLDKIHRKHGVICLISGHCMMPNPDTGRYEVSGADRWAEEWADARGIPCQPFPVSKWEWQTYRRAAGPMRNRKAVKEGLPDLGVRFPGGRGSADAEEACRERGVPVWNAETNELT